MKAVKETIKNICDKPSSASRNGNHCIIVEEHKSFQFKKRKLFLIISRLRLTNKNFKETVNCQNITFQQN